MKILLIPVPDSGHIRPFISLALGLQQIGHRVVIGTNPKYFQLLSEFGIDHTKLGIDTWVTQIPIRKNEKIISRYQVLVSNAFTGRTVHHVIRGFPGILKSIEDQDADLILIDRFYTYLLYLSGKLKKKSIVINTMMNPYWSKYMPPLFSGLSPKDTFFQVKHFLSWNIHPINQLFLSLIELKQDIWSVLKRARFFLKTETNKSKYFHYWKNSFHVGFHDLPEYCLGYKNFDFPILNPLIEVSYLSLQRLNHSILSDENQNIIEDIAKLKKEAEKKLVYFCLGTLAKMHNERVEEFINLVFKIFEGEKDWILIFSRGKNEMNLEIADGGNVIIYDYVPQQQILPYFDAIITHGGLNTVFECVFAEVPMYVFPLNKSWDQPGNGARVRYHGIGQVGNIKKIHPGKFKSTLRNLMENDGYRTALRALKEQMLKEEETSIDKLSKMTMPQNRLAIKTK